MTWVLLISVFLVGYVAGSITMFAYINRKLKPIAQHMEAELRAQEKLRQTAQYWFDR